MLLLFRKIRHKLIQNTSITKYLMYALGEIALVVIGILLAISINNRKHVADDRDLETKILKEIKTDLENGLDEIRNELANYKLKQSGDSTLIAFYYSSKVFNDTLGSLVYMYEISPHFNPINGGYQFLKVKGIDLIENDELRISINGYYEQSIPYYRKYESERIQIIQSEMIPFNNKHFRLERFPASQYWRSWKRMPFDEASIKKNQEWLSIIQKSQNLTYTQEIKAQSHEKVIIELINDIQKELSKKM